jgi:hypothetical protein
MGCSEHVNDTWCKSGLASFAIEAVEGSVECLSHHWWTTDPDFLDAALT